MRTPPRRPLLRGVLLSRFSAPAFSALAAAFFLASSVLAAEPARRPGPERGERFARLNVTVDAKGGASRLPTPFAILPDEQRVALYVPETGGVLLLRGDDVAHHFPVPNVPADGSSALDDLDASDRFLVGGKWTPSEPVTVELHIFDLQTGRSLANVESRNPHLGGAANDLARSLWRVVIDADTVGVYDPRLAATVPLWVRGVGAVESADQMSRMSAGFSRNDLAWIPTDDGRLEIKVAGRTLPLLSADQGNAAGLFLAPVFSRHPSTNASPVVEPYSALFSLARHHSTIEVAILDLEAGAPESAAPPARRALTLRAVAELVPIDASWVRGRPVRELGGFLYWPLLDRDFVTIRRFSLAVDGSAGSLPR